jgi:putative nucleotidyltransferase with HDIG domain
VIRLKNIKPLPQECHRVLHAVVLVLAAWDADLFAHGERVAGELVRLAPSDCESEWYWAGLLHDLGKMMVPPTLLHKRGALTARERKLMQKHSLQGAALLHAIRAPLSIVEGAKLHHERWDGTGYPLGLAGRQIPLVARVMAIADVYTALTSDRPYRRAFTAEQAKIEIERYAGTHFDPELVARFLV